MSVNLKLDFCGQCPYSKSQRHWTADSFETEFDYYCNKLDEPKHIGIFDWREESKIEIPKWCPLRKEK